MNRELLTFHSMATAMRRALRQLTETLLLTHLLDQLQENKKRREPTPLLDRTPFGREYSTIGGVLALEYFKAPAAGQAPPTPAALAEVMGGVADVVGALRRGYDLWHQVYTAVKEYAGTTEGATAVGPAVLADFEAAHALLGSVPAPTPLA